MDLELGERVFNLIDFLAAYDARRNPPVHDIAKYGLFLRREGDIPRVPAVHLQPRAERWLIVDPVEVVPPPAIPDTLADVLTVEPGDDWPSIIEPAESTKAQEEQSDHVDEPDEPSDELSEHLDEAEAWINDVWAPWAAAHESALAARSLYRDLFEVRDRLEADRDAVELVWGFGRLRWSPEGVVPVDHPMFTIPVEVDLDPATRRLRVQPAGAVELETTYLADLPVFDRQGLNSMRNQAADADAVIDPWDPMDMGDRYRRIVHCVDDDAAFSASPTSGPFPHVHGDPSTVIYLRRRRPDYQGFLDGLRELYKSGVEPPDPIKAIVIDQPSTLVGDDDPFAPESGDSGKGVNDDEPLLLPLPANEEQQRILAYAKRRAGVTVQGPPGTGKSHTIANLISHYVAYGKKVLVVAEKEQALKVLAEKIPEEIRALAVSVLGADEEGRRRLGSSIQQIQAGVTRMDRRSTDQEIARLTDELDKIDRTIAETSGRLLTARASETKRLPGAWLAGHEPSPLSAAAWVTANEQALGYIPDPIEYDTKSPLEPGELADLASLVERIGANKALACAFVLPELEGLPTRQELEQLFADLQQLTTELGGATPEVTSWSTVDQADRETIRTLRDELLAERDWWSKASGTWLIRTLDLLEDDLSSRSIVQFAQLMRRTRNEVYQLNEQLQDHEVNVAANGEPSFRQILQDAHDRLAQRGKLGLFAGDVRRALASCRIDGRAVETVDDVRLCLLEIERAEVRRSLKTRWANGISIVDGPSLDGATPELALGRLLDDLDRVLAWPDREEALTGRLAVFGLHVQAPMEAAELERAIELAGLALRRFDERMVFDRVQRLQNQLSDGAKVENASPLWRLLDDDLQARSFEGWEMHRAQVAEFIEVAPAALRLRQLHERLSEQVPIWASQILADPSAARSSGDLPSAWQWRQLETWLAAIRATGRSDVFQRQLEELARTRRRTIERLVAERAWRRLSDNLGDRQRTALNAYLTAIGRYGRTGGKYAGRWLAEMRRAMDHSKSAVPVWIMPTSKALTNFRPTAEPPFDVLVVDEASQLGLHTLPLLALAKRAIVVGDDKQTSPENVGLDQEPVFDLMEQYLRSIAGYRTLLMPSNSLYDIAFQKFPDVVMLSEHFRCLPEIIQFSNLHCYDGRIVALRDRPPRPDWKPLGAVKVLDGYRQGVRSGQRNRPEAEVVADLMAQLCRDPSYDGMTFGVISLLGMSQSKLIWDLLYERIGPKEMDARRIRCGEAANFQGDERDVMILSTVVAVDPANPTARIGAMTDRSAERRINVAASRAANQMWVVHSVDADSFSENDLRGALIRHCRAPGAITDELARLEDRCESDFERHVLRRIVARGYERVRVAHPVGRFRIDLVIEGPEARLAVECDGDQWHGEDAWHRDRARQEILERSGWTFERIRGSEFYRNPERALEPLWARLDELGIPTGSEWVGSREQSTVLEMSSTSVSSAPMMSNGSAAGSSEQFEPLSGEAFSLMVEAVPPSRHQGVPTFSSLPSTSEVREWARRFGLAVGERGRLHPDVVGAWNEAHPDRQYSQR